MGELTPSLSLAVCDTKQESTTMTNKKIWQHFYNCTECCQVQKAKREDLGGGLQAQMCCQCDNKHGRNTDDQIFWTLNAFCMQTCKSVDSTITVTLRVEQMVLYKMEVFKPFLKQMVQMMTSRDI